MPDELNVPPVPPACELIWSVFLALHGSRASGMGPSAISPADMLAYQQMHGVELNPWELDCIAALDRVAVDAAIEQNKRTT